MEPMPGAGGRARVSRAGWRVGLRLDGAHIDRLEALRALLKVEFDGLSLLEGSESVHLDGGVVHEHVGPAIRLRDEAEALLSIEPLDCSGSHGGIPLSSTRFVPGGNSEATGPTLTPACGSPTTGPGAPPAKENATSLISRINC